MMFVLYSKCVNEMLSTAISKKHRFSLRLKVLKIATFKQHLPRNFNERVEHRHKDVHYKTLPTLGSGKYVSIINFEELRKCLNYCNIMCNTLLRIKVYLKFEISDFSTC